MSEAGDLQHGQHADGSLPVDVMNAPLPPPPPLPLEMEVESLPGPPPPVPHPTDQAPLPQLPPMPLPDDMDMDMETGDLPPPPPPPPPQDPSMALLQAADPVSAAPLPPLPITLPAPAHVEPDQQHAEPAQQMGGEMSEEQYNAMTPEQQAAYWHQWQQYSQQYYAAAPDQQQQDPSHQYTQDMQSQGQYSQYQYGQPDAQQWAQYAAQPQQPYAEQQPDYSYYYQQQQAQHGAAQPQGLSQPYPPQVHYGAAPDSSAAYPYQAAGASAAGYNAGLGVPLEMPVLAPPKKTVPDWLRAEMLKRGIGQSTQAAQKQGSDSEPEPDQGQPRRLAQAGGSRWGGEEERGGKRGVSGEDSSDEEAEEKVSRAEELRRERLGTVVKRNLTGILLEVTDMLLEDIAKKALNIESKTPQDLGQAAADAETPGAAILQGTDESASEDSGGDGDALGLGYGSEEGSGSEAEGGQEGPGPIKASEPKQDSAVPARTETLNGAVDADTAAGSINSQDREGAPAAEPDHAGLSDVKAIQSITLLEELHEAEATADDATTQHDRTDSVPPGDTKAELSAANGRATATEAADNSASLANGGSCTPLYSKGSSVWYLDRDRQRQPAVVMALDVTHPPPAYCIRLEGADGTRDTEEARLQPRAAQPLPAPGLSASEAKSAAGVDGGVSVPADRSLPEVKADSSKVEVSANKAEISTSKASFVTDDTKKKHKEKEKARQREKDEGKKDRSSRADEKAQKQDKREDDKDRKGRKASKDEGREKDMDSREARGKDDRKRQKRQRSSRTLSRSRSRDRRPRQRSPSRDRRRDSDRRRSSRSPSRERRRRRSDSRSPVSRKHRSEPRKDRRSRRESD